MFVALRSQPRAFPVALAVLHCAACATYDLPSSPGPAGGTGGGGAAAGSNAGDGFGGSTAGTAGSGGSIGGVGGSGGSIGGVGGSGEAGGNDASAGQAGGGGMGGTGGSDVTNTCAMRPIPDKADWRVTASNTNNGNSPNEGNQAYKAHDGDMKTRWSSGEDQQSEQWLEIDFKSEVQITRLTLQLGLGLGVGASGGDFPRKFDASVLNTSRDEVSTSLDHEGTLNADTVITFPKGTRGRYVKIKLTENGPVATWWSVHELLAECVD